MAAFVHTAIPYKKVSATITLSASNTTASETVFTITGSVHISAFWGEVTSDIGANHTAGHIRTNDQSANIDLSESSTGATLSGLTDGTLILRTDLADTALTVDDNSVAAITDGNADGSSVFTPFTVTKKDGATTTIDYRYTTTDTPTSGEITFYAIYEPLSSDGAIT